MICFEMNKNEASAVKDVIERYLFHLQVESIHTDNKQFLDLLKQRERFLKEITERLKVKIIQET